MNKYRITNPNNSIVRDCKSRTTEAEGIANVMLNRMEHKKVNQDENFVNKIGGKDDFDAIGRDIYSEVKGQTLNETYKEYKSRVEGAMKALSPLNNDNTNGAFFWNAIGDRKSGFNWQSYNRNVFQKTKELGTSVFFKYNLSKQQNPKHYKRIFP